MHRRVLVKVLISTGLGLLSACGPSGPRTLSSSMFIGSANERPEAAQAPTTQAADEMMASIDPAPPLPLLTAAPTTEPLAATTAPDVASSENAPATQPMTDGVFMTLGGVVADVNGTPIYANTLLADLDKEFSVKAREMDAEDFKRFARTELETAREGSIRDEVEFAAAERGLSSEDKKIVDFAMTQFVQEKVTEAGGSIEKARRRAAVDGLTWDQFLHKHLREVTWELYRQHRILPKVQVSADDMRAFYLANVDRLYSQHNEARFRVIKIDPARLGGDNPKAAAVARIRLIRDKAIRGDDFAALASSENHDDYLRARGGDPGGWIERDCYRIDAVDKAIWKIEPGQITDVVEDDGAYYIAKLEDRKLGKTQPFEDPAVQSDILNRLRTQQLSALYEQLNTRLIGEAVIRGEHGDALLDPAVDIAMQRYAQWTGR